MDAQRPSLRPVRARRGRRVAVLASLAVLLLAAGCAPRGAIRDARPLGEITPPTLESVPGQTRIARFDPPGAGESLELDLVVLARNPNDFGVRLERLDYRIVLGGRAVAEGVLEPGAYMDAGGSVPLRFPVTVSLPPRRPLVTAVARAFTGEPLPFRLEGRMRFTSPGYGFETRDGLLVEGELSPRETVEAPQLRIDDEASRVFELRAGVPVVQVTVRARNPGEIGYFLSGKDVAVRLAGQPVGLDDLEPLPLPAGGTRQVELLFYPDPDALDADALDALEAAMNGIPTGVTVDGELFMDVLGVDTFPVAGGLALKGFITGDGD